jgi:hypothetical protein
MAKDDLNGPDDDNDDDVIDTGADGNDDDDNDDDKGKGKDGKDGKKADDADWKPPTKAEWEQREKYLAKARQEAKERREKLAELARKDEDDTSKATREAAEAAEKRYKPVAIRAAAKAAFLEAGLSGVTPEKVSKLTRMLDLDAIDIDDDGEVSGLEDQVSGLRTEFPEMFGEGTKRRRAPNLDTGDRKGTAQKPKSSAELIAASVLSGS